MSLRLSDILIIKFFYKEFFKKKKKKNLKKKLNEQKAKKGFFMKTNILRPSCFRIKTFEDYNIYER